MTARHRPRYRWWAPPLFVFTVPAIIAVPIWLAIRILHYRWWPQIPTMSYTTAYVVSLIGLTGVATVSVLVDLGSGLGRAPRRETTS